MRLNYERRGHGEPLVLLHGGGNHWQVWKPVFDQLATAFDVIAVDFPGHGDSPVMETGQQPTPANFARVLVAFLEDFGIETAHLVGNSTGGWTALELAKLGYARSVTCFSPAGLWRNGTPWNTVILFRFSHGLARRLARFASVLTATAGGRTLLMSQFFGRPWQIPAETAAEIVHNFATAPGVWSHIEATAEERFVGGQQLEIPVTIAWGSRDMIELPWQARRREELPPQTRWLSLPGCGHVPMYDNPELVVRVIREGSTHP